ncbi:helix-turn-helix domain-containing protein [Weissella tructae]|nr:helix-turn-helix domain-containing protein [Weissella tructae]
MNHTKLLRSLQKSLLPKSPHGMSQTSHFDKNMRYFRLQSQLRKKELAALLNVDTSTISNYERGRRRPNFDTLIQLSDIFDVTIDELLR